jgi:hypothetical protein
MVEGKKGVRENEDNGVSAPKEGRKEGREQRRKTTYCDCSR